MAKLMRCREQARTYKINHHSIKFYKIIELLQCHVIGSILTMSHINIVEERVLSKTIPNLISSMESCSS